MKKILLFGSGFVAGIIATILVAFFLYAENQLNDDLSGLTILPEIGESIITKGEIEVFQVLKPNMALARLPKIGTVVLLINYDGKYYYDEQKIKIPAGKCGRQIGIYQYTSRDKFVNTVPVIVIE